MLVLGDLACPNAKSAEKLIEDMCKYDVFKNNVILCNLEGMIRDDEPYEDEKLFNHSKVLDAFETGRTVFSIANNHTYDYPELIERTNNLLKQKGYESNGLYNGQVIPTLINEGDKQYAIFTHCWRVYTETNPNRINSLKIVDCPYSEYFNVVKRFIIENPDKRIICYFHWNYDMETLPFPAYRQLSHELIDIGAFAVVGNHSHVPQGGELYKGHPIVYGLGNFYIPSGVFFGGRLAYPEQSKKMMVLEIEDRSDELRCYWFWTDKNGCLELIKIEDFSSGIIMASYSPYRELSHKKYLKYFKGNRVKRKLVPVFKDYQGTSYSLSEFAAISRIKLIKKIKR